MQTQTDKCDTDTDAATAALPALDNISIVELTASARSRKISGLTRAHSTLGVINIALNNETGQPDVVEIDRADDEEDNVPISPLVSVTRSSCARHNTTPESGTPTKFGVGNAPAPAPAPLVGPVKHKAITERLLRRRNSENAFQVVMQVAQSRKETLVKLIDEHQQIIKEIEKWSSVASLQSNAPATGHNSRLASETGATCEPLAAD